MSTETFIGFAATLLAIGYVTLMVWFVVIAVRFLRSGRKAFDRYLRLTSQTRLDELTHEAIRPSGM